MNETKRKYEWDYLRCVIVILVIFFHTFYLLNTVGAISNVVIPGIRALDSIEYFLYPWFMSCLFLLAGMSARYSLSHRTRKEFLRERTRKLLIPSIFFPLLIGFTAGWVTDQYLHIYEISKLPESPLIRYIFYVTNGTGVMWFVQELYLASLVLILITLLDQKDVLYKLGGKLCRLPFIILLVFPVWGSANILNPKYLTVYRNGIYIFIFLLGYYVFSHEEAIDILRKYWLYLLIPACLCGIAYTFYYFGKNYASLELLTSFFTSVYTWLMILAMLGTFSRWFTNDSKLLHFLKIRNFPYYALHMPIMVLLAYFMDSIVHAPVILIYPVLFLGTILITELLYQILPRIPVLKRLLFGL